MIAAARPSARPRVGKTPLKLMRTCVLGSGSRGNAVYVETPKIRVLVDCGFNLRETKARLASAGFDPDRVDAILVTHEHHDHVQGAAVCAKGFRATVYATPGTREAVPKALGGVDRFEPIVSGATFDLADLRIDAVPKPHDAADPVAFVLSSGDAALGVFTDLGFVDETVGAAIARCDTLMIEANHDPARLRRGPYPPSLKARIAADTGHLSNAQAAAAAARYGSSKLKRVIVCHLSEANNSQDDVRRAFVEHMGPKGAIERRWSFQDRPTETYRVGDGA
jgi:phosphoribosyl 1,2-cyclic phosphodiesterase